FLGESLGLTVLAMLLALALVELFLPMVSALVGRDLGNDFFQSPLTLLALIVGTLVTGILAGAYPAFSLSAFAPSKALKGGLTRGESGIALRNVLVVLQFVVSI